jgi:hypothetical protein
VTETTKAAPKKKTDDVAPTSATTGEDAGNYTVTSSIEFGYRGQRVDGDVNKYKSDLNYKAGPRLFDSSFYMKSKDGKGDLFDTMMVTSTGWGADPYGNLRMSVEAAEVVSIRRQPIGASSTIAFSTTSPIPIGCSARFRRRQIWLPESTASTPVRRWAISI